jgi:protein TonB
VQQSTDPVFERPALAAVKQWRFEPGKRNGKPVRFRMRVPITFPKG